MANAERIRANETLPDTPRARACTPPSLAAARRNPWLVLADRRWREPGNCRRFLELCEEVAAQEPGLLMHFAAAGRQAAVLCGDRHVIHRSLAVEALLCEAAGTRAAARRAFEDFLRAAEECCDECRAHAQPFRARLERLRRSGTRPPDVLALSLTAAGESLLSLPLTEPGVLVDALYRLAWTLVGRRDDDEEALAYLKAFGERLRGQRDLGEVREAWFWVTALVEARRGNVRLARERLGRLRGRAKKARRTDLALALTADRGRNFGERFPGRRVEAMLDECLDVLELDDGLRDLVETASIAAGNRDRDGAVRALTELRAVLDVPVPDLLADG